MRKLFLTFVASLLCSIVSFAQFVGGDGTANNPYLISTKAQFEAIAQESNGASGKYFKQTADINLGVYENRASSIISTFRGTFDGDGHTITYQAQFSTSSDNIGLFGTVSGTIENLTLNASVTISSGGTNWVNVGLLCGTLTGTLENCHATNCNINSVITTNNGHGISVGLLVGKMSGGTLKYSSGVGNVTGNGRVGGLVGEAEGNVIYGCSFIGEVVAVAVGDKDKPDAAGGICGEGGKNTTINLCYVNANITATDVACGIVCKSNQNPTVTNCYAAGTVNGMNASNSFDITNANYNSNSNNWCDNQIGTTNTLTPEYIAGKLNDATTDPNINFGVASDEVIFGVVSTDKVCETPINLTIANTEGAFTASWTSANANNTITESHWHWSLTGGNAYDNGGEASSVSVNLGTLPASSTPYTFMVYTDCSETVNGLTSSAISQQFYVDCPAPTGLTASNITDNGFTISWTANVDCQLTVNGINYEIVAGNPMTKQITGLEPETQYTAIVKAKCGNDFVEQASINVTTAHLSAPTGLTVTPTWEETSGKIVVTWTTVPGLTYEIYGESGDKVSGFEKTGLSVGANTLKLRAKKGEKTSEWVSMPYTISNPEAPKNPIVTPTQTGETFTVSIDWTKGVETATAWKVGENEIAKPYVLTEQAPGSVFEVAINEISPAGTSAALVVPVLVPCLPATAPTAVATTQTSVRMTWETANSNRKVIIGSTEYAAGETTLTIDGLEKGTAYSYQVREYCNAETYSSVDGTFATAGCFAVSNLTSVVGVTTATISWTSQSPLSGLRCLLELGDEAIEITETSYTFTNLDPSTTYSVYVYEECGNGWENGRLIEFTTLSSDFETEKSGLFNETSTWKGGRVPAGNIGTITINQGHEVTLANTLTLSGNCQVVNNGVLKITQLGQLVNTTNNNVGGIVEVETDQKTMNAWTFVGAPFACYALEAVKPVSGSDVAMVKYNYTNGNWSDSWATIATTMEAAEGTFAWTFYEGAITFTTYGDVENAQYDYEQGPKYALNNGDVTVTKNVIDANSGKWMALSNPYPAKLSIQAFLDENTFANASVSTPQIQGKGIYVFNGTSFDYKKTGDIAMTKGFFVNFENAGSNTVYFKTDQLSAYTSAKSSEDSSEFIELTLQNGNDKVRVYLAHNEDAEQGYDIYDANKMFATTGVAEPYFVTEGIPLIKEEVRDLPYYATMNVRSQEDTVMNFVLTNLPEGYAVSIIDGEEVIDLVEGGVYSTEIASGENADRFKVLVKKNVGLADVEELDVRITNSNRHITITAQENVRTEVYNTLGQKVFETEETNFVLSGVASGAYVVKVQGTKASKSQKIVVE